MADDDTTTTADTGETSDARLDALESRQDGMDSKLDRILELLPGRDPKGGGDGSQTEPGSGTSDIQSTVRKEIAETKAREQEEARARGDADWRTSVEARLEELKPESTPREPERGPMGRIRRAMYGRAD